VVDQLCQLKSQFEEKLMEREAAYEAKVAEITANKDEGSSSV